MSSHILSLFAPLKKFFVQMVEDFSEEYSVHTTGFRHGYTAGYVVEDATGALGYVDLEDLVGPRDFAGFGLYLRAYSAGYDAGRRDREKGKPSIFADTPALKLQRG